MNDNTALIDTVDEAPEIPWDASEGIASWRRTFALATGDKTGLFRRAAIELVRVAELQENTAARQIVIDELAQIAADAAIDPDEAQAIMADAFDAPGDGLLLASARPRLHRANGDGHVLAPEPPTPSGPDDYGAVAMALPKPAAPAVLKTPADWPNEEPPPVDWLAYQRIPCGDVTTLHGDGGAGKTDIALRLAANVARAAPDWLGHEIAHGPVVLVSAEEPEREIWRRLWLHGQRDGYAPADLTDLHLWFPERDAPDTALAIPDRASGIMRPTPLFDSLGVAVNQVQPVLIVVDNVAATFAGNQNDRVNVRTYVNLWRAVARIDSKPAVLLIDHPSLSGLTNNTGRGGNMDWRNAVRSALYLRLPEERAEVDRGIRVLETMKSNYGPPGNPLRLQWADGGLEREDTPTSFHRLAKDQECEQVFLRLLDERNAQGRHVGSKPAGMYAPKVFGTAPDNAGYTKAAFAAAMERLFAAGIIRECYDAKQRHRYIDRAPPVRLAEAAE